MEALPHVFILPLTNSFNLKVQDWLSSQVLLWPWHTPLL